MTREPMARARAGRVAPRRAADLTGPRARLARILRTLRRSTGSRQVELHHRSPFELLVATILSAQSTDKLVNRVTPALFTRYPTAADVAGAHVRELERLIKPTGFYRAKARNLIACARVLCERHGGRVPRSMEALVALPGVGRKTANVVLGNAFGVPGVVVDTHVKRVARRLGLTGSDDPDRIESDLQRLLPRERWTAGSQGLLLHGRYVCKAKAPLCDRCPIAADCSWEGKKRR